MMGARPKGRRSAPPKLAQPPLRALMGMARSLFRSTKDGDRGATVARRAAGTGGPGDQCKVQTSTRRRRSLFRSPRWPAGLMRGSIHRFKYRLALVADSVCVLRYDNEAGKGDHRHIGRVEKLYKFVDPETIISRFLE